MEEEKKSYNIKFGFGKIIFEIFIATLLLFLIFASVIYINMNELTSMNKKDIEVSLNGLQMEKSIAEVDTNEDISTKTIIEVNNKDKLETPKIESNGIVNINEHVAPSNDKIETMGVANSSNLYAIDVKNAYIADGKKIAYLTFDDGPTENITPHVLDVLAKYNIKATFFTIGKMADTYPEILKRVVKEGHAIGNHTYSHDYKKVYASEAALLGEVKVTEQAFKNILGADFNTRLFRFPGGSSESYKKQMISGLNERGYLHIDWNTVNGDEEIKNPTADWLLKRVKETSAGKNKIVVLMHDSGNKQETLKALPSVIEYLSAEGYEFKTLR